MNSILDRFLLAKPVRVVEFPTLVGLGHWDVTALSAILSSPLHSQVCAHGQKIERIARHILEDKDTLYLILIYFGLCTRLGNSLIFIPAIIFTTLTISANQEEKLYWKNLGKTTRII